METKEVKKESVLVNQDLMNQAFNFGIYKTKEEVINKALQSFIEYQEGVKKLISTFGTIEYDFDFRAKDLESK